MKTCWKELVLAVVLAWGMPWIVMAAAEVAFGDKPAQPVMQTQPPQTEAVSAPRQIILVWSEGVLRQMELTDYLTGVLISEMPGSFHGEAKKAQAIVARTYTLRRLNGSDKHPGAVCTDSRCCQGYLDPDTFDDPETVRLARSAVEATENLVLTYGDELIDATYFSCSGGMTEDAVAVWGSDVPYLQSVESPGEEIAAHYTDTVSFTKEQIEAALGISLKGSPGNWIGTAVYTEGDGVASIVIGGKSFRGTQIRSALGLRSTAFEAKAGDGRITFTTKGYGHRVGMSQYGAQAMALSGNDYRQILAHYYTGTLVKQWNDK